MKFPFVTRAHHEEVVEALARLLYPQGVPKEFQLLLGLQLGEAAPAPVIEPEDEEDKAPDAKLYRKIKNDNEAFKARLSSLKRTSPSRVGPAIEAELKRRAQRDANLAHPASRVFAMAREQVK